MSAGVVVLLLALVAAAAFGLLRACTDGRFAGALDSSATPEPGPTTTSPAPPTAWSAIAPTAGADLGEQATLVQFSSAFCAPCRATRRILTDVARTVPGVVHVEIDAELHLDLVRHLEIARTPTTLILGPAGIERSRAVGAPRTDQVLAALAAT